MKNIRIILVLTIISLFTLASYDVAEARDCSNPKGFHEKMVCKLTGQRSSVKSDESNEPKKESDFTLKLKKFLGKKNNEVTGN